MSKEERIQQARERFEKEVREAEIQEQFKTRLGVNVYSVHLWKLYDRIGTVNLKTWERYSSISKPDEMVTPIDVLNLAKAFPGVPLARVKGNGSVSFWTRDYYREQVMKEKTEGTVCDMIAPVMIRFDFDSAKLIWIAQVPEIGLVEFTVSIQPYHPRVGNIMVQYKGSSYQLQTENRIIERCELNVAPNLQKVMRGETQVGESRTQKYSSGSNTSPNPYVLYWIDVDSDQTMSAADVIASIWELKE
jgi:hypothetical protein